MKLCPYCGSELNDDAKFCGECGAKKPEPKAADTWDCPACGNKGITGKFCGECGASMVVGIVCPTCGKVNPEGQKFCGDCGAKLAKKCPSCGKDNDLSQKFCGDCGTKL